MRLGHPLAVGSTKIAAGQPFRRVGRIADATAGGNISIADSACPPIGYWTLAQAMVIGRAVRQRLPAGFTPTRLPIADVNDEIVQDAWVPARSADEPR